MSPDVLPDVPWGQNHPQLRTTLALAGGRVSSLCLTGCEPWPVACVRPLEHIAE